MKRNLSITFVATILLAMLSFTAQAGKPNKPGGGGGGGGNSPNYEIIQLDDQNGFLTSSGAYDINRYREIVGGADGFAAYWSVVDGPNGVQSAAYVLSSTGFQQAYANGINDHSEIVGQGYPETGVVGLYWPTPDDEPLALTPLPGDSKTVASKININGIICGSSSQVVFNLDGTPTNIYTPVVWQAYVEDVGGVATPAVIAPVALPKPDGTVWFSIYAINDLDDDGICQIVGNTRNAQGEEFPLRWTVASTPSGLVAVPYAEVLDSAGRALGINNNGEVSGSGPTTDWLWRATVWSSPNTYALNRARNIGYCEGTDINDAGVVVGWGNYEKGGTFESTRAAVWASPQSDMVLIDRFLSRRSPFFQLNRASAVNPTGDIVGWGWTGADKAYLAIRR